MRTLCIVKVQITADALPRLTGACIFVEVDLLVLEAPPEPFGEDVVRSPAPAVHADLHLRGTEEFDVGWASKLAALIAVDDPWTSPGKRPAHRLQDKGDLQGLIELPINHVP